MNQKTTEDFVPESEIAAAETEAGPRVRPGVKAPLTFIVPQEEKPKFLSQALTGGESEYLFEAEQHEVEIADLRPRADQFTLDRNGFAFRTAPTQVADLRDDEQVQTAYYREIEDLLMRELGASAVYVFDATRRADAGAGADNPDGKRLPAVRIHVDYTDKSGPTRARDAIGAEDYERVMARGARIVQVNVWRPITSPVLRSPLAIADASSVEKKDLIATEQIFPDRVGEIYFLAHNPRQRWYYAPEMTRDEVLLIKGWDTMEDGRARYTPHCAFQQPDQDETAPARESIEIRTFAVIGD